MSNIKWVKILEGEFQGREGILGQFSYSPCGRYVTVHIMIDGKYEIMTFRIGQGKTLRERLKGKVEDLSPILSDDDKKKIEGSDFFLALVEEDFFTNELAVAQLKFAISCKLPIHILKLKSVDLQLEYFADGDIKTINDFETTGELVLAVGKMMANMRAVIEGADEL